MKIIILGNSSCGKTALIERFVNGRFLETQATIGTEAFSKIIEVDRNVCKLEIWDTAGQEKFNALSRLFYRGAKCAVLVYDITDEVTFTTLSQWRNNVLEVVSPNNSEDFPFILIGNKADKKANRVVARKSAQSWCDLMNIPYFECSAKTNLNVDLAFYTLIRNYLKNNQDQDMSVVPYRDETNKKMVSRQMREDERNVITHNYISVNHHHYPAKEETSPKESECKC